MSDRPADADQVMDAFRLGWSVAEMRGRNDPHRREREARRDATKLAPGEAGSSSPRAGHALPLGPERSDNEQAIAASVVAFALAGGLGVGKAASTGEGGRPPRDFVAATTRALRAARRAEHGSRTEAMAWGRFAEVLYRWDESIQDQLSATSETLVSGYLLGRGLAEAFWALDPDTDPNGAGGWITMLGTPRCVVLSRLLGRLASYFDPLTAPAIAGSLQVWRRVAEDERWRTERSHDALVCLREQTRRWYELLALNQDPQTLIGPYALLKDWRSSLRAAGQFAPQLAFAAVSALVGVAVVAVLATGRGTAILNALGGFLALFGLSAAALQAAVKNRSQALAQRFRDDLYTDLIVVEITASPALPSDGVVAGRKQTSVRQFVRDTSRQRSISSPVRSAPAA